MSPIPSPAVSVGVGIFGSQIAESIFITFDGNTNVSSGSLFINASTNIAEFRESETKKQKILKMKKKTERFKELNF